MGLSSFNVIEQGLNSYCILLGYNSSLDLYLLRNKYFIHHGENENNSGFLSLHENAKYLLYQFVFMNEKKKWDYFYLSDPNCSKSLHECALLVVWVINWSQPYFHLFFMNINFKHKINISNCFFFQHAGGETIFWS